MVLVRIVYGNKAGKEKSTKVLFESKQSGNPILWSKRIFAVLVVKRKKLSLDK